MAEALQIILSNRERTVQVTIGGRFDSGDLYGEIRKAKKILEFAQNE